MNDHTPEHTTEGLTCWCYPRITQTTGTAVVVHRSWAEILKQRDELLLQTTMLLGMIEGRALAGGITLDAEDLAALKTTRRTIAETLAEAQPAAQK